MKAIVFDNAGTILKRITAIKDMESQNIFFETNTIGIANENPNRIIVVFQQPTSQIIKENKPNTKIHTYMKQNEDKFEISYSQENIPKNKVIEKLANDTTTISQITQTRDSLMKHNIEICSGSALIVDIEKGKITHVFTAGGVFFNKTKQTIKTLIKDHEIYIASGDNHESLIKIADILGIKRSHIYDTQNRIGKQQIVNMLKKQGYYVYMVGNNLNDELALQCADTGILTLEQKEELPQYLIDNADYTINHFNEILEIIEK